MSISSRTRVAGALSVTGVAVGLGFANAAAAEACGTPPPPPPTHDQACDNDDVQFKAADAPNSAWTDAKHFQLKVDTSKPVTIDVQYISDAKSQPQSWSGSDGRKGKGQDDAKLCTVSLAQYLTDAPDFKDTVVQTLFGKVSTVHVGDKTGAQVLTLPALSTAPKDKCDAQVDLYWGDEVFDGHDAAHPSPTGKGGPHGSSVTPFSSNHLLIGSWNGAIADACQATPPPVTTPPVTTPPVTTPPVTTPPPPATTPPATTPPVTTPTPSASTPKSSPPSALTVTPPATPTLAETGSDAFPLVIVALTLFGVGTGSVYGSRKLARKH